MSQGLAGQLFAEGETDDKMRDEPMVHQAMLQIDHSQDCGRSSKFAVEGKTYSRGSRRGYQDGGLWLVGALGVGKDGLQKDQDGDQIGNGAI